jgi:uncharacterized protein (DUF1697 family)
MARKTTQRHIAFLRAINVGGHTVKMEHLRALFEALGFANVETFIASGNVIFDAPDRDASALEQRIERHLEQELGYEVATFLRTPAELAAAAAHTPTFPSGPVLEGQALSIGFLKAPLDEAAQQKLLGLRTEVDDFHARSRELYWACRVKVSESKVTGASLEKKLGMRTTVRNVTTVRKLAAKYAALPV